LHFLRCGRVGGGVDYEWSEEHGGDVFDAELGGSHECDDRDPDDEFEFQFVLWADFTDGAFQRYGVDRVRSGERTPEYDDDRGGSEYELRL
jgi:hypothetical protein